MISIPTIMRTVALTILSLSLITACNVRLPGSEDNPIVAERYLSPIDKHHTYDSLAVWHGGEGRHWLIATAKGSHRLVVQDATTGSILREVGQQGPALGDFDFPNGISVVGDLVMVVERDNRRVQLLSLPDFEPLGSFGEGVLQWPYGIWARETEDGIRVYVTDDRHLAEEEGEGYDRRLHQFSLAHVEGRLSSRWLGSGGDTEGLGVLHDVESVWGDPLHDHLLVADEDKQHRHLKLYDMEMKFSGRTIGDGVIRHEPEGIAQYSCPDGRGYWLVADQDDRRNTFRLFERGSLEAVGAFEGKRVRNTDGIWLSQSPMPGFPRGALFAVHNDRSIAAFDLDDIFQAVGLEGCASTG